MLELLEQASSFLHKVNKQGGSSVSWKKHGLEYGWQLSMCLAGWIVAVDADMPQLPPPSDPGYAAAARAFVACVKSTHGI